MGNVVNTIIGSLVVFYLRLSSKVKSYWNKEDDNNYSAFRPHEIILKDDEEASGK